MSPLKQPHTATDPWRRGFLKTAAAAVGAAMTGEMSFAADRQTVTQKTSQPDLAPPDAGDTGKATIGSDAKSTRIGREGCPPEVRAALSGPWPSVRTPFTCRGEIDFDALRRNIDLVIQAKAKAVVLTWGDSLYSVLSDDEIAQLTKTLVQYVNRHALVVAATGTWWTGKAVDFAKYCVEIGADMLMVLPPDWAHSTTVDTLVAHYRAVTEHIPVMLVTNYLGPRGVGFGLELCRRLYDEVPGVVALKDDLGGEFIRKVSLMTHDRWALSAGGQKQNHLLMLPYGVDGYLSTFMNFKPEIAWRYWKAIEVQDLRAARDIIRDYDMPLFDFLVKSEGSFDAALHGVYELYGLAKRYRRPPYYTLTDKQMEDLAQFLHKAKIL
jgi:4-hydroxy-tetrahydrodipicolinate synthase